MINSATRQGVAESKSENKVGNADLKSELRRQAKVLAEYCATYKGADTKRSTIQVIGTAMVFAALCAGIFFCIEPAPWAIPVLALPAAGFLIRLFIIQHDCGHGSFFQSRFTNDMLGRMISVLTLTPYGFWRRAHAQH
ncbi:MAG: fatty acid desaturase, partial [Rhodospirillales bacterium]|nr:fatty acid desaturase [Rhodospirillales bacterium]